MQNQTRSKRVALVLFCLGCGLGLLGLLMLPANIANLFGLEPAGPLSSLLPPDPAPLSISGSPVDRVALLLPPHIAESISLTSTDVDGLRIVSGETTNGRPGYYIELTEEGLNNILERWCVSGGVLGARCCDLQIDLQPGGVLVSRVIGIGPWATRLGVLLLAVPGGLDVAGILIDEDIFEVPDEGPAERLATAVEADAEQVLWNLSIVSPLPKAAFVEDTRFHADQLEMVIAVPGPVERTSDSGWHQVEHGVETRMISVHTAGGSDDISIVRLDPTLVTFSVHYEPGNERTIADWSDELDPLLVINGGYFDTEYETIYLIISAGQLYGTPLGEFAGMFAAYAGSDIRVEWLEVSPYSPESPPFEAVQSFPILVKPGGIMAFPSDADMGLRSRRTAVAQDLEGRILVVVAPGTALSLHELAVFLSESDMGIDIALNLDGGGSTGLYLSAGSDRLEIDSLTAVPSVIVAELR